MDDYWEGLDIPEPDEDPEEFIHEDKTFRRWRAERRAGKRLDKEEDAQRNLRVVCLADEQEEDQFWLWRYRIPLGELTLVGGKAGIGKSLFLSTFAAWVTVGDARGEFDGTPRNVLYIANEDNYRKTVIPRLKAAGADVSRVFRIDVSFEGEPASLMFPRDIPQVERIIEELDVAMVIIDPLSSNMTDRDRNSPEVRRSYERLSHLAERTGVAILGNGHMRKGQARDFLEGFMGSSEIGNVVRAAIGIVRDPDSEDPTVILSQCKNNNGPDNLKSYTYTIVNSEYTKKDGTTGEAPRLIWGESTEKHFNDLIAEPSSMDHKSDVQECREWLKDYLHMNPGTERAKVVAEGRKAGFKEHTIKSAGRSVATSKNKVGVYPRITIWYARGDAPDTPGVG